MRGEVIIVIGRVKWFNFQKGYGIIQCIENEEIFVHYSTIKQDTYKALVKGQLISFELVETCKGSQMLDVVIIDKFYPSI